MDEKYSIQALSDVMETLLGPDGCPWDQKQTHESIRKNLLEEAYEVVETIDAKDTEHMKEELGDLLLQVLFHAMIAEKNGEFTFADVVESIAQKLIHRHPHIFADATAEDDMAVLSNWEEIKRKEKGEENESIMNELPPLLPALMKAEKVQEKARRVGFDWDKMDDAMDKVYEELDELKEAVAQEENVEGELGDVLFSVVNVSRFIQVDAEKALMGTVDKFISRFRYIETKARLDKRSLSEYTINELDAWWDEAKEAERAAIK